ncbi:hypothetical protein P5673_002357 [Acropora cervicornis]|uniref:Uncharacterized protein n=1 Tax=Acropora cervicornis TaxID=6130 RepID=A0AAD9VFK1_ACRCE|nr:hypothetical protein P5673_002356 [Acropora cervicornis]KAK2572148.1 hypothetical protein P5673_002357 [Acropora cervicornis]
MEKEKSKLRKLKKSFVRRKKLYEARQVNRKFQQDPGSVHSCIGKMLEKQQENEKPRDDRTPLQGQQNEKRKFEGIEEASEFWRALWEGTGNGNAGMEWIEDVREAMKETSIFCFSDSLLLIHYRKKFDRPLFN